MKRFALCIILGVVLSCDMPKNLRMMESDMSAAIGISVTVKLYNALPKKQTTVYFVKLDEKDKNNLGVKIIPCNYYRGNMAGGYYAYLVNAEPGTYAAVCSTKYDKLTATDNPAGSSKSDEYGYITFFESDIINKTRTEVGPAQIAFMGSYTIESRLKSVYRNIEKNGDMAQQHYFQLLKPFMEGTYYLGSLVKADKSGKSMREFLVKTKGYFRNSEWLKIVTSQIEALDKSMQGESI
jgi:hypothetical protein